MEEAILKYQNKFIDAYVKRLEKDDVTKEAHPRHSLWRAAALETVFLTDAFKKDKWDRQMDWNRF